MQDLAIFIDSYDGNSDVWDVFFKTYDLYWKDCCFPRFLITNEKKYDALNLTVINTGSEKNWFLMSIRGLESINNDFIFFILEDQLISKKMNNDEIKSVVSQMKQEDVYYYRMTCPNKLSNGQAFIKVPENTPYPISLQPAIWKREVFLQILKELYTAGCRSPWDFEKYFIDKYRYGDSIKTIEGIRYDSRNLMGYKNILIQGKWDPRVVAFFKKNGVVVNTGTRPFMAKKTVIFDGIKRNRIVRSLSIQSQLKIKSVLKKLGFKFMT